MNPISRWVADVKEQNRRLKVKTQKRKQADDYIRQRIGEFNTAAPKLQEPDIPRKPLPPSKPFWFEEWGSKSKKIVLLISVSIFAIGVALVIWQSERKNIATQAANEIPNEIQVTGEVFLALNGGTNLKLGAKPITVFEIDSSLMAFKSLIKLKLEMSKIGDELKPIGRTYTDSDGRFSIKFPHRDSWIVVAQANRWTGERWEDYFWAETCKEGGNIVFSNFNLVD